VSRRIRIAAICCWLVATAGLIAAAALNPRPPVYDEQLNLHSSARIWYGEGPFLSRLRAYEAPQTPLTFLLTGAVVGPEGSGVAGARVTSALVGAVALFVAILLGGSAPVSGPISGPLLVGAALLGMPYYLYLSTHYYTDIPALMGLLACMLFWFKGRYGWAGIFLAVAVSSRQYAFFAWLGFAAVELLAPRGGWSWKRGAVLLAPSMIVMGAFGALWGGMAPRSAASDMLSGYMGWPKLGFVNYYIVCIGAYTGWTLLLRGEWKTLGWPLLGSAAASVMFWLSVPGSNEYYLSREIPIYTLGFVDRIATIASRSGLPRPLFLWLLWIVGLLCLIRIARQWNRDLWSPLAICWCLSFLALHSVVSLAHDKYYLLLHLALVMALVSRPGAGGERREAGAGAPGIEPAPS